MGEKVCRRCKEIKLVEDFNWRNKQKNKRQSYCRPCQLWYTRQHYKNNKGRYIERALARKTKSMKWYMDYLFKRKCVDCGMDDIRVLDFDHIRGEKHENITTMAHSGYSIETLELEAEKCEIRCRNCHTIRHIEEDNSLRQQYYAGVV